MSIFDKCYKYTRAEETKKSGCYPYFKAISSASGPEVIINGKKMIMIGSNNYLGLTQHPDVITATQEAVAKYGSGCTGSRFLNGTLDIHEELESDLASFMKKEATLLFSTGFQTNQGVISTIVGKNDYIVIDREDHASIIDGCRLSFGKTLKYKHNDMEDLERIISSIQNPEKVIVIVDGVFSMGGDLSNLPEICKLKTKYGFSIMVDDAHGIGVMGENGRGTSEHFGVEDQVDVIMGTFSKSFSSIGGFVVANKKIIDYIKHNSRALIFSASMPPAAVATVKECLKIIQKEPERRKQLWKNTNRMMKEYKDLNFNTGNSKTPIIPIILGDQTTVFGAWKFLTENGIFVNPVIQPAVAPGEGLLRTSYMATHKPEHLDIIVAKLKEFKNFVSK